MASNAPPFDPINPTPEEQADMVAGYLAAGPDGPGFRPNDASMAYEHGWRMRRNDLAGLADDDQRILAKRFIAKSRGLPDPFPPTAET